MQVGEVQQWLHPAALSARELDGAGASSAALAEDS